MRALLPLPALLLAAACTAPGLTAESPCFVMPGTWNMDDQNPIGRVQMLNTGRACGITVSNDRRPTEQSAAIVQQPSHGAATIRRIGGVVLATYTPAPGFSGQDTYQARFGPGSQTMTVDVTVRMPPT